MANRAGRNLTAKFIDGLKAGPKLRAYPDTTDGLELYVTPERRYADGKVSGGAKTFSFRYTLPDGTRRRLNLGKWPGKDIASARAEARTHLNALAKGRDPAAEAKAALHALRVAPVKTLDELTAELLRASKARVRPSTLAYWEWLNRKHLAPRLGDTRLGDLGPGVIRKALREVGEAAGPTTANRAFALLRRAFNFGLEEEHVAASPMARVKKPFEEATRARVLADAEIKALWSVAEATKAPARAGVKGRDEIEVSRAMAIGVQLCLVTAQRGGEVAGMRAAEIDVAAKTWIIPAERTKANREHVVPLTDLALELIAEAAEIAALRLGRAPTGEDPIFPTPHVAAAERDAHGGLVAPPRPVARLSLGRAMSRLCAAASLSDASAHDLRRTASTIMASERIGALSEVVARILNHAPPGLGVTAIYNRHAYIAEKRRALEAWSAELAAIVGLATPASNVHKLARP